MQSLGKIHWRQHPPPDNSPFAAHVRLRRNIGGSVNIPIAQLDSATARRVQGQAAAVVVVDPGDYRGQQACVRLTRVFGFSEALLLGPEQ